MKKLQKTLSVRPAARQQFPHDEANFPWLQLLLDAYATIDEGITKALGRERKKRHSTLACKQGCSQCCKSQTDIPVYPLELVGIYWYCIEKLQQPLRDMLKKHLMLHSIKPPCPFLLHDSCSIHAIRPIACRLFNVFSKPCGEGEDPYFTRRNDVLTPLQQYTDKAFFVMLPFYGITRDDERAQAIQNGFMHTKMQNLQTCNWKTLAGRMNDFDANIQTSLK